MDTQTLITPLHVLDRILALNLDISLWSARTKLTEEDFGGAELPPEDLASLGSKKICDPARPGRVLKTQGPGGQPAEQAWRQVPFRMGHSRRQGGRYHKGLCAIRDEFFIEKQNFLASYDEGLADWIARHPAWAGIIQNSTVSRDYVDTRMKFTWQLYRVAPAAGLDDDTAMTESGLHEEVEKLGNTLFEEIARDASDIWRKVFEGKTEVTHKALSPLKTMRDKLIGLSFVEPHVVPVIELIETALAKMPKRGSITGAHLLMLQGMVCILKEQNSLLSQTQAILTASSSENALDTLFDSFASTVPVLNLTEAELPEEAIPDMSDLSIPLEPIAPAASLDSMGLW